MLQCCAVAKSSLSVWLACVCGRVCVSLQAVDMYATALKEHMRTDFGSGSTDPLRLYVQSYVSAPKELAVSIASKKKMQVAKPRLGGSTWVLVALESQDLQSYQAMHWF
jgi:hypothetical protein